MTNASNFVEPAQNSAEWPLSCYDDEGRKTVVNCNKKFGSTRDDGSMIFNLESSHSVNVKSRTKCRQVDFNKNFLISNNWAQQVISYKATEVKAKNDNHACFYKYSPRSNVLVFNRTYKGSNRKIYMKDLVTEKFYQINAK